MMNTNWIFNPAEFEAKSFEPIPAGAHRVRIGSKLFSSNSAGLKIHLAFIIFYFLQYH